jgi:hypothetical protein
VCYPRLRNPCGRVVFCADLGTFCTPMCVLCSRDGGLRASALRSKPIQSHFLTSSNDEKHHPSVSVRNMQSLESLQMVVDLKHRVNQRQKKNKKKLR